MNDSVPGCKAAKMHKTGPKKVELNVIPSIHRNFTPYKSFYYLKPPILLKLCALCGVRGMSQTSGNCRIF